MDFIGFVRGSSGFVLAWARMPEGGAHAPERAIRMRSVPTAAGSAKVRCPALSAPRVAGTPQDMLNQPVMSADVWRSPLPMTENPCGFI